ncbi:MAG TPA: hypothetical protein VFQ23_19490 [Anaerolineales bacterium]|nr:hypothetical protein [Anaerolineales bacterium]
MGRQLTNLTFEEWLTFVFDHPVPTGQEKAWYWEFDADEWDETHADVIQFLTQAFENAEVVFQPYTDAQLNQGLWYIADNSCSNHMFALLDTNIPWNERQRCVDSIHQLYEQCFAKRCSPHLSHIDEPGANPLNAVCYMWWDIIPIYGMPEDPDRQQLDHAILQVMDSTLQLDSIACRESALHGLGHWQHRYPERIGEIINRFSMSHRNLPKALEIYMRNAFVGYVL